MPALTQEDRECFLRNYANDVPANCQDDIALLIWRLRRDVWPDISQDQDNVTVYERAHNQAKVNKPLAERKEAQSETDAIQVRAGVVIARAVEAIPTPETPLPILDGMRALTTTAPIREVRTGRVIARAVEAIPTPETPLPILDGMRALTTTAPIREVRTGRVIVRAVEATSTPKSSLAILDGIVASKEYQMTAINSLMEVLQRDTISTPTRIAQIKQFVSTLQSMFRTQFSKPGLQLEITGSYANGLCALTSDVDVTLTGPIQGMMVRQLTQKLLTQPQYENIVTIADARVPIVTFRYRDISCDISINQELSIHNSKLVKTYEAIDPRVQTIWFSLKHLAKKNGILSAKEGFLSSYALSMMLITYLQTRSPPVLPLLQQQVQSKMTGEYVDGVNCSFDTYWYPYMEVAQKNKASSGDLLVGFLRFFGHEFNYSTMEVNPRLGQFRPQAAVNVRNRFGRGPRRVGFWVMDPFLVDRNVAGMCRGPNVGIIKDAFQKAYQAVVEDPLGALTLCEI